MALAPIRPKLFPLTTPDAGPEIDPVILGFLDSHSLAISARVNRAWKQISENETLWDALLENEQMPKIDVWGEDRHLTKKGYRKWLANFPPEKILVFLHALKNGDVFWRKVEHFYNPKKWRVYAMHTPFEWYNTPVDQHELLSQRYREWFNGFDHHIRTREEVLEKTDSFLQGIRPGEYAQLTFTFLLDKDRESQITINFGYGLRKGFDIRTPPTREETCLVKAQPSLTPVLGHGQGAWNRYGNATHPQGIRYVILAGRCAYHKDILRIVMERAKLIEEQISYHPMTTLASLGKAISSCFKAKKPERAEIEY